MVMAATASSGGDECKKRSSVCLLSIQERTPCTSVQISPCSIASIAPSLQYVKQLCKHYSVSSISECSWSMVNKYASGAESLPMKDTTSDGPDKSSPSCDKHVSSSSIMSFCTTMMMATVNFSYCTSAIGAWPPCICHHCLSCQGAFWIKNKSAREPNLRVRWSY